MNNYHAVSYSRTLPEPIAEKFLTDCVDIVPGATLVSAELYRAYLRWTSESRGLAPAPVTHTAFSITLREMGLLRIKSGCMRWMDLRLKEPVTLASPK